MYQKTPLVGHGSAVRRNPGYRMHSSSRFGYPAQAKQAFDSSGVELACVDPKKADLHLIRKYIKNYALF